MALPRVVLADDWPEILEEITRLLRDEFDIVDLARNGEEALKAVASLDPDLVTFDISMPLLDGIQVASRLRERRYNAKVIFVKLPMPSDGHEFNPSSFSRKRRRSRQKK